MQASDSEEETEEEEKTQNEKKWVKKKPPKKAKLAKSDTFDTGLDLALDEELALHLLGTKS